MFHAESLAQTMNNIAFESTTISDLAEEQKKHAQARRNHSMDPASHERYKDFAKELANMKESFAENRDSEELDDNQRQRIDPISKKPIRNPVMNRICKHIYDKQVVLEAIKMNSHMR